MESKPSNIYEKYEAAKNKVSNLIHQTQSLFEDKTQINQRLKELKNHIRWQSDVLSKYDSYISFLSKLKDGDVSAEWLSKIDTDDDSHFQRWDEDFSHYKTQTKEAKKSIEEMHKYIEENCIGADAKDSQIMLLEKKKYELQKEIEKIAQIFGKSIEDVPAIMNDVEKNLKLIKEGNDIQHGLARVLKRENMMLFPQIYSDITTELDAKQGREINPHSMEQATQIDVCNLVEASGVKILHQSSNQVVVEISSDVGPGNPHVVEATINYNPQKAPHPPLLTSVQFVNCPVATADIVEMAQEYNNFFSMVPVLQERIENSHSLIKDIENLRRISAIDWLPDDNLLKLIVGKYVCFVKITDSASFELTSVKGLEQTVIDEINKSTYKKNLLEWVQFIEEKLSKH